MINSLERDVSNIKCKYDKPTNNKKENRVATRVVISATTRANIFVAFRA